VINDDHYQAFMRDSSGVDSSQSKSKVVFNYYDSQFHDAWAKRCIMISARDLLNNRYQSGPISDPAESRFDYFIDEIDSNNDEQSARAAELGLMSTPEHPASVDNSFGSFSLGTNQSPSMHVTFKNTSLCNMPLENTHIFCTALERNDARWEKVEEDEGGPYDRVLKI